MSIVYSLIGVTKSVDEPTEVVGLAGSPPTEDGCVQMLSSVTEDKLSDTSNGVNISCRFLVSVNVYLLVPNTLISVRYKRPARSYKCHPHTFNTPSLGNVQHHKGIRVRGYATIPSIHSKRRVTTQ